MPKTAREIVKILKSNGFKKTGQTGSHAKFYNSKTKRTVVVPIHNGAEWDAIGNIHFS